MCYYELKYVYPNFILVKYVPILNTYISEKLYMFTFSFTDVFSGIHTGPNTL